MQPNEELCLCFHVTRRKVANYLRLESPQSASQLSECYGAGTGCGWCRPFLKKMFDSHCAGISEADLPTASDYSLSRSDYVRQGGGTLPPGATPVDDKKD